MLKLDMRMGKNKISAYELVNEASLEDLIVSLRYLERIKITKKLQKKL